MADAPPHLPGGNTLPSGTGFPISDKQNNGEALQERPIAMQNNNLTLTTAKSLGFRIIYQPPDLSSTPKLATGAPPAPATASTASRGVTPSVDNESSNKQHDNRDTIMGGGYETRGTYRGNGAGAGSLGGTHATPQPQATGAPARIYMNEKIVPYLLEGMKMVAKDQ
ncbi:uncharacterized protein GIQ15_03376 [Arthroderma uncinatum]|uniref:uncharacterized protein n=1 Tax=Arthroderma uncinatum TaxID=74035 RepID=UPI00144AC008|nr:uncharacterized protein GIQ15_03376 [Arthroderma uncinatum]KAF3484052.1 hypothetical protein GIQ15_03376 [Arthroderma uncinatum]